MRQNVCQPVAPSVDGGLLLLGTDLVQHRLDLADDERQGDEDGGDDHAGQAEDHLEARLVERPEPAADAPEHDQGDADHDRRDRERQVDHGLQQRHGRGTDRAPGPAR